MASQLRASSTSVFAQPVVGVDRPARIVDPEKVADRREQAGRRLPADRADSEQGHQPAGVARQEFVHRDFAAEAASARQRLGHEGHLAFDRRGDDQFVFELALLGQERDELGGQRLDAACRVVAAEHVGPGRSQQPVSLGGPDGRDQLAAHGRAHGMDQRNRFGRRQIVEMDEALAKAVAALSAPKDQRHGGGRHRAVGMTDKALEDARLAPPAARPGRGRDPLLVRAAQKQPDQGSAVEQPARPRASRSG